MRCISNHRRVLAALLVGACLLPVSGCEQKEPVHAVSEYERAHYNQDLYQGSLLIADDLGLCVAEQNQSLEGYEEDESLHGAALFDVEGARVLYAYQMHDRLYPASTTKIMTALLALEHGSLGDTVTVSATAAASAFPSDAQVFGLEEGDTMTLEDLLHILLLYSGNDSATAIAEYVAGSEEAFAEMMNARARSLFACNTHFVNPHGLHEDDHYTTAYDLYLIFNECIKQETFLDIIQKDSYTVTYQNAAGETLSREVTPTNLYALGYAEEPGNVTVAGGKTGTTGEAGSCLILLEYDSQNHPYISVIMGADDKTQLYTDMTALLRAIPAS